MSAASLAGLGFGGTSTGPIPPPPKLTRQVNRLSWVTELVLNGYVVVPSSVVHSTNITIKGEEVVCPADHVVIVANGVQNSNCRTFTYRA